MSCFKIKHTKGGLTKYRHLKTDLLNCVSEKDVLVSTLIDFYALPKDFPKYEEASKIVDKAERLTFLESAIVEDIQTENDAYFPNLIPYIQLHEFEALVFSSLQSISSLFGDDEADFTEIRKVIETHPNPEDINDNPKTAPSKRLISLIKGYHKVVDGIMIIEETGIETVLEKCTRFNNWVETLIKKVKE